MTSEPLSAGSPVGRLLLSVVALSCLAGGMLRAATPANVLDRPHTSLAGQWAYLVDPYETGFYDYRWQPYDARQHITGGFSLDAHPRDPSDLVEYAFDDTHTLAVPGDWNTQDDHLFYYEGTLWYRRRFTTTETAAGTRQFIHFGAANYRADVYLDGRKLGMHVGGFTPFDFEVTGHLPAGEHSLVVRVDNRRERSGVPTLQTDWWNYGGITRDVLLVTTPETYVADYGVQLRREAPDKIAVRVQLDGPALTTPVQVSIPELDVITTLTPDATGLATADLPTPGKLERWSPEHPRCYAVTVTAGADTITEPVGFRTIETRGHDILLNGKPIFLRGVSLHEENPLRGGRAHSADDARMLLGWARELGCNFIRLAHYPHNENMPRLADQMGLLLWEEIPVYWTIDWENPDTLALARRQLAELIQRDHRHASVIVWSVANETPVSEARTKFLTQLVGDARALDGTRLVSAAMEVHTPKGEPDVRVVDDPFGAVTDLVSFNEYVGWYDGLPDKCSRLTWRIAYDKPVFISEFGGGALAGKHGDKHERFTEEFQAWVYRETLPMLDRIPHFSGTTPWILVDFRSPRRLLPGIQDGWNRKGLIGSDGTRKEAFSVLHDYYAAKAKAVAAEATP